MIEYKKIEVQEIPSEGKGRIQYLFEGNSLIAEEVAIKYYQMEGYKVQWTENDFWWKIMSLLFWEVIFAKIKGAVIVTKSGYDYEIDPDDEEYDKYFNMSVLQMNGMPSDFFTNEFYTRRKQIIANRIKELKDSDIISKLQYSYESNYGKKCRPIENWNKYSLQNLSEPLTYIDKNIVIEICHRLLKNFTAYRSGFPDLFVYSEKEVLFVEVKSKDDRISESQINWHNFISENLNLKLVLFLINHTDRQISNLKKRRRIDKEVKVKISFGRSSSKKRQEAIEFISNQTSFIKDGDGVDAHYSAEFSTSDIYSLFKMLDLTSGWKSQRIEINSEEVHSTKLRNSLWCYRQKCEEKAGREWCMISEYNENKSNPFNCRQIQFHQFESGNWDDFGYIDSDNGDWVFDKQRIKEELESNIIRLNYCPLLESDKILKVADELPERLNPKINLDWAFKSQDYKTWIWYNGKWISSWGDDKFPSFAMMIGIERISKKERNEIIKGQTSGISRTNNTITFELSNKRTKAKKQSSGCFIATCAYGSYDSPEVLRLRKFRDKYLFNSIFGRVLVDFYYRISPFLSHKLKKHRKIRLITRKVLDIFISFIDKYLK